MNHIIKYPIRALMVCLMLMFVCVYGLPLKPSIEATYSVGVTKNSRIAIVSAGIDRRLTLWNESGSAPYPINPVEQTVSSKTIRIWGIRYDAISWPGRRLRLFEISMIYPILAIGVVWIGVFRKPWLTRLMKKHRTKQSTAARDGGLGRIECD